MQRNNGMRFFPGGKASFLRTVTVFVLGSSAGVFAMNATTADGLATDIITQLGYTKGFTYIANCGDGELVRAFLKGSGMKVLGQDAAQANVDATRALIKTNDLDDGIRFYCDKGTLAVMPYTDRFVDVIVIANLTDADLAGVSYAEVERALCPEGLGWIGSATGDANQVTQTALETWINDAAKKYSTATISTTKGTWAVVSRKEMPGATAWRKYRFDGSNGNSDDTVASFPFMGQAKTRPNGCNLDVRGSQYAVAAGGRLYTALADAGSIVSDMWLRAYNVYNGEFLWQKDLSLLGSLSNSTLVAGDDGVFYGSTQYDKNTGETKTGGTSPTVATRSGTAPGRTNVTGCNGSMGVRKAFNKNIVLCQKFGLVHDTKNNKNLMGYMHKTNCGNGPMIAHGFCIFTPQPCACAYWPGGFIYAPKGNFVYDQECAEDGADRLEQGPAYSTGGSSTDADANDWTTYRKNYSRSGYSEISSATLTTAPGLRYHWVPKINYVSHSAQSLYDYRPDMRPTPPIFINGMVYFGGSDGYVRCINDPGKRLEWEFKTGGRIYSAPTFYKGRIYAGSADGWAYCLDAATGQLIWRFRGAPVDRRMNNYGFLESTWPIMPNIIVQDDKAYFVAGSECFFGVHAYCVDALTGELVWQNAKCGSWFETQNPGQRRGYTPMTQLAVLNGKMYGGSGGDPTIYINMSDGTMCPIPVEATDAEVKPRSTLGEQHNGTYHVEGFFYYTMCWGSDMGVVTNTLLAHGGRYWYEDDAKRSSGPNAGLGTFWQKLTSAGEIQHPQVCQYPHFPTFPVWDGTSMYYSSYATTRLGKTAIAATETNIETRRQLYKGMIQSDERDYADTWGGGKQNMPTWEWTANSSTFRPGINALLLTPTQLLAVYYKASKEEPTYYHKFALSVVPESQNWYLGCINPSTGASIWEVQLPNPNESIHGEPAYSGLAMDKNGIIAVTLRNGDVVTYGPQVAVRPDENLIKQSNLLPQEASICIYDMKGALVEQMIVRNSVLQSAIAKDSYANFFGTMRAKGIYAIQYQNSAGQMKVVRFVKSR